MIDLDPWETLFLDALLEDVVDAPPVAAFAFRRAAILRYRPGDARAALLVAAAELLAEDGMSASDVNDALRSAMRGRQTILSIDWLWNAGRGDLIGVVMPQGTGRPVAGRSWRIARVGLPILGALTVGALSCRL
ncbi:hypothetical protein [Jannaschia sp. 2305UL9-9]|uniref:hypothetical protein n=1 Tax=Jannaschia sp. 2305UL9-9 TaxID=3121638 RepID=UPI003528E913